MWAMLLYLVPFGIVIIANLGVTRRGWRLLTYVCLGLLNAATLSVGVLFLSVPFLLRLTGTPLSPGLQGLSYSGFGPALTATALLGFAGLATPLRRLVARGLPIDPDSPVHATALVFLIYLLTTSLGLLLSGEELVSAAIELAGITPGTVVLGQVVFTVFALAGVGLGVRRSVRQTLARLDLRAPTLRHLGMAAVMTSAFLALDYGTSLVWHRIWPTSYEAVMQASQQLFARFASPSGALVLALSAGIGEETLFRGALQPRFRIPLTAVLFTLGHVQYAISPAMVEILVIGLALGWLRERSNTTTCMAVHIGYNFLDMLIMPYFP
jgi:membrane protease YdiL (CAAX protease family)